ASGGLSVTIITAPPAAPSAPDLADASDTGASNTDNLTKLTTLTFNGTAVAGVTVQIFVDGVGTATGGNYSIVVPSLTAGGHNITAQATDAIGNVSPVSGTLVITIDASVPAAPAGLALDSASD